MSLPATRGVSRLQGLVRVARRLHRFCPTSPGHECIHLYAFPGGKPYRSRTRPCENSEPSIAGATLARFRNNDGPGAALTSRGSPGQGRNSHKVDGPSHVVRQGGEAELSADVAKPARQERPLAHPLLDRTEGGAQLTSGDTPSPRAWRRDAPPRAPTWILSRNA